MAAALFKPRIRAKMDSGGRFLKSSSAFLPSGPGNLPVSKRINRAMILSNLSSSSSVVSGRLGGSGLGLRSVLEVLGGCDLVSSAGSAGEKERTTGSDTDSMAFLRLSFPKSHHQYPGNPCDKQDFAREF